MKRRPMSVEPQVRHFSGVPRAVFEALFPTTPGGLTFRPAFAKPNHRCGGLDMPGRLAPPVRHAAKSPQRRTLCCAGTVRLRLPRVGWIVSSPLRGHRILVRIY